MTAPWKQYCTPERLAELNDQLINQFGGSAGVREPGCPEATLGNAWLAWEYSGGERLPHLIFAAYALYYFATKQCFVDGNKRIAWASMLEILSIAGLTVAASQEDAWTFVLEVANRNCTAAQVVKWIEKRLISMD